MKLKYIYPFTCLLVLMFASCVQKEEQAVKPVQEGEEIWLPIRFQMSYEGDEDPFTGERSSTKAPTNVDESGVFDVWLLQFDGIDNTSTLVSPPQYISNLNQPVPFIQSNTPCNIVAVANTGNPDFPWKVTPGLSTYREITEMCYTITSEHETYFANTIMMCGVWSGNLTGAGSITFSLSRNVAKLTFTITNSSSSGLTIKSVQMCNVNMEIELFAGKITHSEVYPAYNQGHFVDFSVEPTTISPGISRLFTWYLPRNQQGQTDNTDPKKKNSGATANATYLKVLATDASGETVIFRFYPGVNMTNDFNIKPNSLYTFNLTINGKGDSYADGRIEDYTVIDLAGKAANSYILNPPPPGSPPRRYRIYPKQVNIYWGADYENIMTARIGSIQGGDDFPWWANIVWMDDRNVVSPIPSDGYTHLIVNSPRGDDNYFTVEVPSTALHGNFTVGVFREETENGKQDPNEPYVWSYHFWVTDYHPDAPIHISPTQYSYNVVGGAVHRYKGNIWENGIYKDAVIMDRNLGALLVLQVYAYFRGALYYQYGRKDPFINCSYAFPYRINDNNEIVAIPYTHNAGTPGIGGPGSTVSIQTSIQHPYTFYTSGAYTTHDWMGDPETSPLFYLWKDKKISGNATELLTKTAKSIFDPCPYGWQIPQKGTYDDFVAGRTTHTPARGLGWNENNVSSLRYWPGNETDPISGLILHPAVTYSLPGYSGGLSGETALWLASPFSDNSANMYAYNTYSSYTNASAKANGLSVRCIKLKAN